MVDFSLPAYTVEYARVDEFVASIEAGSVLVTSGDALEERTGSLVGWESKLEAQGSKLATLKWDGGDHLVLTVAGDQRRASLFDDSSLVELFAELQSRVYLDVTGLEHSVWASILRSCVGGNLEIRFVYAEPDVYTRADPDSIVRYNLSDGFRGLSPLPGFARLTMPPGYESAFAPLLGFEGSRLDYLWSQYDFDPRLTFPVVGLPGFRLQYPTVNYLAHENRMKHEYLHRRVRFAKANCPFEAFEAISELFTDSEKDTLRIAPLGTKPHAMGAVLFALANPEAVEILYDHPIRKPGRTTGISRMVVYDFSSFMMSEIYRSNARGAGDGRVLHS